MPGLVEISVPRQLDKKEASSKVPQGICLAANQNPLDAELS